MARAAPTESSECKRIAPPPSSQAIVGIPQRGPGQDGQRCPTTLTAVRGKQEKLLHALEYENLAFMCGRWTPVFRKLSSSIEKFPLCSLGHSPVNAAPVRGGSRSLTQRLDVAMGPFRESRRAAPVGWSTVTADAVDPLYLPSMGQHETSCLRAICLVVTSG